MVDNDVWATMFVLLLIISCVLGAHADELARAAKRGDLNRVQKLVEAGADVNHRGLYGMPLDNAVNSGQWEIVRYLLEHGGKIGGQRRKEHLLCEARNVATARVLLEHGANVNRQTLFNALYWGRCEVANYFVAEGASLDPNYADNRKRTLLHAAARGGCSDLVTRLTQLGAKMDARNSAGDTPLHLAIREGHREVADLLLDGELDPGVAGANGETPLFVALERGHRAIARFLVERGAKLDPSYTTDNQRTLFHAAAEGGCKEFVSELIEAGADVNSETKSASPLYLAARNGHDEIASMCLQNGAKMDLRTRSGDTPLHAAALRGHVDAIRVLVQNGANINARNTDGDTPFSEAVLSKNLDAAKWLLKNGPNIDADANAVLFRVVRAWSRREGADPRSVAFLLKHGAEATARASGGQTPLHYAVVNGYLKITRQLINAGADVRAKDDKGHTPLHDVTYNWPDSGNQKEIVKLLLKKGAKPEQSALANTLRRNYKDYEKTRKILLEAGAELDPNYRNRLGKSLLHAAASGGAMDAANKLLKRGANIDAQDKYDRSPLHLAVRRNRKAMVKFLVERGAQLGTEDRTGATPLWWAAKNGLHDVVSLLMEKGALVAPKVEGKYHVSLLHVAAEGGCLELARQLLQAGAETDVEDRFAHRPLHMAAKGGHEKMAELLIGAGATVSPKQHNGEEPLHFAARKDYKKVALLLIKNGADVNAKNNDKATPLHWAAREGQTEVSRLLINHGAALNSRDQKELTPLHYAARVDSGRPRAAETGEVTALLIRKGAEVNARSESGCTPLDLAGSPFFSSKVKQELKKHGGKRMEEE